jgi:membrane-bound inhibitor of C-type lysozyme
MFAQGSLPTDVAAHVRKQFVVEGMETRYVDGSIDLNADGKPELIVHLVGPAACGSGGCPTLVYTPAAGGYRLVTTITVSNPPIGASKTVTRGWRNLVVHVRGGGAKGHEVELLFDGESYPSNPSVASARVTPAAAGSDVVIRELASFTDAQPLSSNGSRGIAEAFTAITAVSYQCKGRETTPFTAAFNNKANPPTVLLTHGDRQVVAQSVRSASGARYQAPDVDFWEHQGEAAVTWSGASFTCVPVK